MSTPTKCIALTLLISTYWNRSTADELLKTLQAHRGTYYYVTTTTTRCRKRRVNDCDSKESFNDQSCCGTVVRACESFGLNDWIRLRGGVDVPPPPPPTSGAIEYADAGNGSENNNSNVNYYCKDDEILLPPPPPPQPLPQELPIPPPPPPIQMDGTMESNVCDYAVDDSQVVKDNEHARETEEISTESNRIIRCNTGGEELKTTCVDENLLEEACDGIVSDVNDTTVPRNDSTLSREAEGVLEKIENQNKPYIAEDSSYQINEDDDPSHLCRSCPYRGKPIPVQEEKRPHLPYLSSFANLDRDLENDEFEALLQEIEGKAVDITNESDDFFSSEEAVVDEIALVDEDISIEHESDDFSSSKEAVVDEFAIIDIEEFSSSDEYEIDIENDSDYIEVDSESAIIDNDKNSEASNDLENSDLDIDILDEESSSYDDESELNCEDLQALDDAHLDMIRNEFPSNSDFYDDYDSEEESEDILDEDDLRLLQESSLVLSNFEDEEIIKDYSWDETQYSNYVDSEDDLEIIKAEDNTDEPIEELILDLGESAIENENVDIAPPDVLDEHWAAHHGVPSRRQQLFEEEQRKRIEELSRQREIALSHQSQQMNGIYPPPPPNASNSGNIATVGYSSIQISSSSGTLSQKRVNVQFSPPQSVDPNTAFGLSQNQYQQQNDHTLNQHRQHLSTESCNNNQRGNVKKDKPTHQFQPGYYHSQMESQLPPPPPPPTS